MTRKRKKTDFFEKPVFWNEYGKLRKMAKLSPESKQLIIKSTIFETITELYSCQ
ncbi:MAG: hypothetical protein ACKPGT_11560 [Microcystis sp.]